MPIREITLKSYKEQIFELFSEGAQPPPRSSIQGWLEPPSPHVVGAYVQEGSDVSFSENTIITIWYLSKKRQLYQIAFEKLWIPYLMNSQAWTIKISLQGAELPSYGRRRLEGVYSSIIVTPEPRCHFSLS